jgi:hypothetical protein
MEVKNIFELENTLIKETLSNFDQNTPEYKEYVREFDIYTHMYVHNKNYFDELTLCVFDKALILNNKLTEKQLLNSFLSLFSDLKKKKKLIFNEKLFLSQLIVNIILHSFDLCNPLLNKDDISHINSKKHQYETIEFIKEKLINFQLFYFNGEFINLKENVYKSFI